MKFVIAIVCVFSNYWCFSQFTIIPTGTESSITEIEKIDDYILINGIDGYLTKCYGNCNTLIDLTVAGYSGYKRENLNMIDTSVFYISSHKDFPHFGNIYKTNNGGETWTEILDTNEILFSEFFMFDENNGIVTTTSYNSITTNNDGETWESNSHGLLYSSASLRINDSTAIMGITENISYTKDKGNTWEGTSFVQSPPMAFYAENIDTVYAVTYGVTGVFFSFNFSLGGAVWTNRNIPNFKPYGIYVKNPNEVYVTGQFVSSETCGILKTTDLGSNWSYFDTDIDGALYDIEFINDSIALIGGSNGLLIKWNKNSHFETSSIIEYVKKPFLTEVYPNPTNSVQQISINVANRVNGSIELLNIYGQEVLSVFNGEFQQGINKFSVNLLDFPNGIYFYSFNIDESNVERVKIIKN